MVKGFPLVLLDAIVCQKDLASLLVGTVIDGTKEYMLEGTVRCSSCEHIYYIRSGILDLLGNQDELESLEQKEMDSRNKRAEAYDKRLSVRYEKEVPSTMKFLGDVTDKRVIEYGCGTGRLTVPLSDPSCVIAVDFSRSSLEVLATKTEELSFPVGLILADAVQCRTANKYFDVAFSTQLIEHIPTRHKRAVFFSHIEETLTDDGEFVCSMYHQDLRRKLAKQPVEGMHGSDIFFHYFSLEEVQKDSASFFSFERSRYIDITLPFEARLSLSPRISGVLSRIVEYIPVLRRFGHLLLVRLKKVSTVSADVSSISGRVLYRKRLSSGFFQKCWIWFSTPFDIPGASLINAFSYTKADVSGFRCKEGLTSIVDLTLDETILWENCRKSFIRKQITRGERAGIEIRQCTDFSEFKKIYTAFRKAKSLPLDDVYMFTEGVLFGAYYKGEMIAANIYITEAPFTRLWVAASKRLDGSSSREVVGWANRMLIWESMKWFKKYGYTHFDLGGFSSDSTDKKEQSLAEFKESYGGERTPCFYYHKVNSSLLRRWMRFRGYAV